MSETNRERSVKIADEIVERIAAAGYLPQNRTYSAIEIADLKATVGEDLERELNEAVEQAVRERANRIIELLAKVPAPLRFVPRELGEADGYWRGLNEAYLAIAAPPTQQG